MKIINLLLESGADVNSSDGKGKTSIMLAATSGHLELVKKLLQFDVDLQTVDNAGFGSITYAKTDEIRNLLIDKL